MTEQGHDGDFLPLTTPQWPRAIPVPLPSGREPPPLDAASLDDLAQWVTVVFDRATFDEILERAERQLTERWNEQLRRLVDEYRDRPPPV